MGKPTGPIPPLFTGVLRQAAWVNCESIDTPTSSTPQTQNNNTRKKKTKNTERQTKVKSRGQKNNTRYLPRRLDRLKFSMMLPSAITAGATKSGAGLVTKTAMGTHHQKKKDKNKSGGGYATQFVRIIQA